MKWRVLLLEVGMEGEQKRGNLREGGHWRGHVEWSVWEMEGQSCRGEGGALGVAGELWGQVEGTVSGQDVCREVGEKEGEGHVFMKGNRRREGGSRG